MPGPQLRLAGRLQRPVRRLAGAGRTGGWCARSRPARSIWSTPTGPRCWRCRRSRRVSAGRNQIRLGRDYYVRLDSNDYSVDPTVIGRQVTVTADLERVRVRLDGRLVADHARVWARRHDRHRPRPRRRPPEQLREQFSVHAPSTTTRPGTRTWPTTTGPSGSTGWRSPDGRQATEPPTEAVKQIHYLAAALKAPRITEAAARLADQARDAGWTHEDYLAAVLEREVSARNASGAAQRIRWAGFPARKTLEDFDWDPQPAVRQQVAALASGAFLTEARNVVLLGPPGTGKTHLATALGVDRRPPRPPRPVRHRDRLGHPPHRRPPRRPAARRARPAAPLRADHRRRGRLPPLRARRREPVLPARVIPLRTRLADPHLEPALLRLGRRLRRPGRRRRDDRPHRPPRRRPHPQRRQLPAPQPRHRQPPQQLPYPRRGLPTRAAGFGPRL